MIKTSFCYIAHRGNLVGVNPQDENNPHYIDQAINQGYDVEIDLWAQPHKLLSSPILFLGHDLPQYEINLQWLLDRKSRLWIHCKNLQAFVYLNGFFDHFNFFFHNTDQAVLTSCQYIWRYPAVLNDWECNRVIDVMPERHSDLKEIYQKFRPAGVCSDFVSVIKQNLQQR